MAMLQQTKDMANRWWYNCATDKGNPNRSGWYHVSEDFSSNACIPNPGTTWHDFKCESTTMKTEVHWENQIAVDITTSCMLVHMGSIGINET